MKKNKLPSLVVVVVLTLITAVMWVSFNIYRSLTAKPSPVVPAAISNPLNPNLDLQTLNQINSKIFLDDSQILDIAPVATAAPTPVPTPESLPSPTPNASASPATESGELTL